MIRSRLISFLYRCFILVAIVAVVSLALYVSIVFPRFHREQTLFSLRQQAALIEPGISEMLRDGTPADIAGFCAHLHSRVKTRITVVRPDGVVIGDTDEDPAVMDNHADRPEIQHARIGEVGISTRFSATLRKELMYVALPLYCADSVSGVLRVSYPMASITEAFQQTMPKFLLTCVIILAVAALLSLVFSRQISRPVEELKGAVQRFAHGDLEHKLHLESFQELNDLAEGMNEMAQQLNERLNTITAQRNEQTAILSSMVEGVLALDSDDCIVNINQMACRLFDVAENEVMGSTLQEAIRNPELHRFVARTKSAAECEEEILFSSRTGEPCFFQLHGTVVRDSQKTRIGTLVVVNNITRLKKLENLRREFVANVSHELRTPLTSIKGFVETLQDGAKNEREELERFLEIISNQVNRLNSIIEDLLALSQIEEDVEKRALALTRHPLRPVVKEAMVVCAEKASQKGIRLASEVSEDILAFTNPLLLEQAVINLIDNAMKYSAEQTDVVVRARTAQDGYVVLSVLDHGCGISEKHLPRLFERFYRIDKARSRKLGGTGLGLAIVKHIMDAHLGHVKVESTLGEGTSFHLYLRAEMPE